MVESEKYNGKEDGERETENRWRGLEKSLDARRHCPRLPQGAGIQIIRARDWPLMSAFTPEAGDTGMHPWAPVQKIKSCLESFVNAHLGS